MLLVCNGVSPSVQTCQGNGELSDSDVAEPERTMREDCFGECVGCVALALDGLWQLEHSCQNPAVSDVRGISGALWQSLRFRYDFRAMSISACAALGASVVVCVFCFSVVFICSFCGCFCGGKCKAKQRLKVWHNRRDVRVI